VTIDERLERVTKSLERLALQSRAAGERIDKLEELIEKDAAKIRHLVRIAEIHGGQQA
jgi:hypothetical protein